MTQINEVHKLKVERMLDVLDGAEGSDTSMISILVPSGADLNKVKRQLTEESTHADNVQSRL